VCILGNVCLTESPAPKTSTLGNAGLVDDLTYYLTLPDAHKYGQANRF